MALTNATKVNIDAINQFYQSQHMALTNAIEVIIDAINQCYQSQQ